VCVQDNVKHTGRQLGKLSHSSPGVIFTYMLSQIQVTRLVPDEAVTVMSKNSVVDPDPQGSGTFAGSGSVTRGFRIRIRVHIRKWM
jgi:Transcription- and export-related complex subunit